MSKQLPSFSDICLSHSVMSSLSLSHDICELRNCSETNKKSHKLNFQSYHLLVLYKQSSPVKVLVVIEERKHTQKVKDPLPFEI